MGHTIHKAFSVPVPIYPLSICKMEPLSSEAKNIIKADLLIFDESSATHKDIVSCVDRFVREITEVDEFMGGKVVVFTGDWRQCCP